MKNHRRQFKRHSLIKSIDLEEYEEQQRSMKLATAIKNVLSIRQISIAEFAEIMGRDKAVIDKWLSGTHYFNLSTLYEITEGLGIL